MEYKGLGSWDCEREYARGLQSWRENHRSYLELILGDNGAAIDLHVKSICFADCGCQLLLIWRGDIVVVVAFPYQNSYCWYICVSVVLLENDLL